MTFTLPNLPYSYDALEPFIDAKTMEIHHSKHHNTYVNKLNEGLANYPELLNLDIENLVSRYNEIPDEIKNLVKNHGGGHLNHSIFWTLMSTNSSDRLELNEDLKNKIGENFGGFDNFLIKFKDTAISLFGSGWTWLVINKEGKFEIKNYINQENPLMYGEYPVLGIDVWEHAYYLKHQNLRNLYVALWMQIINWREVESRINKYLS
jgi:Fe-Mn family superoxide dismutase